MAYTPRLSSSGMQGTSCWYSENPYYKAGYGLPNCTAYAWGRWCELMKHNHPKLSTGNARDWFGYNKSAGYYKYGSKPQLGAIACYDYSGGGHVAVVEQINSDGSFVVSQSGYSSKIYFWTETYPAPSYKPSWMKAGTVFQGFIYLPSEYGGGSSGGGGGETSENVSLVSWVPG